MNKRKLGNFGSWNNAQRRLGIRLGPQDDKDSIAAIEHAVKSRINWIDTAAVYGLGRKRIIDYE
jgi:aryl-alcohol dehydrogenase-like predicted oxidoreductase